MDLSQLSLGEDSRPVSQLFETRLILYGWLLLLKHLHSLVWPRSSCRKILSISVNGQYGYASNDT